MANKLQLTRDELSQFLGTYRQVKQFERVLQVADEVSEGAIIDIQITAGTAQSSANQALSEVESVKQLAEIATIGISSISSTLQETDKKLEDLQKSSMINRLSSRIDELEKKIEALQAKPKEQKPYLNELQDINSPSPSNNSLLEFDIIDNKWKDVLSITVNGLSVPYINSELDDNTTDLIGSSVSMTDYSGASVGTLNNCPSAGDPDIFVRVNNNGTNIAIPGWII